MTLALSNLVPFLRKAIDDADASSYVYSDNELIADLKFAIMVQESEWNQGYNIDNDNNVAPDPPSWVQMLYVLKAAIMKRTFELTMSYKTSAFSITRTSKVEDLRGIQELYDNIVWERRYSNNSVALITSWDDYLTRLQRIYDKVVSSSGLFYPGSLLTYENGWY